MSLREYAFEELSGADEEKIEGEAGNWLRHAASLGLTKSADGLFDPKLVLSWLLTALSVPSVFVGLLVPIREAGALLPQLLTAPRIHAMPRRKWAWAGAAAVQGLMVGAILLAALTLEGAAAGWAICIALAVLALGRSVASVSYKDVLGKTVSQSRRGAATGTAATVAAGVVIVFAGLLIWAPVARMNLVIGALCVAAAAFLLAAVIFVGLSEKATPDEVETSPLGALAQLKSLWRDPVLGRFVIVRGLLVSTSLAPPYLVMMAANAGNEAFQRLGALVLAAAVASLLSSYVWGRLADRSSRWVLVLAGGSGAAALVLALGLEALGLVGTIWALPLALFALMIAYHGVRQGRSTYLVDMSPEDKRLEYAAAANTAIGITLLGTGVFGALASAAGPGWTIGLFAAMAGLAAVIGLGLPEAEAAGSGE
ncbi:MFS transporter [Rhodalgimonas zhirmunskyi]|uniref:MFS transporter n=1 Tax=Rhodalgimonas zhirmunskyi TaxID=2964767 RepID=A0AAJ1U4A8_9RHOB|nr:MFS transporter [Rhodoalgimonas zhirmunskyi]MDQ2093415.1 MFS transporter [Rhodoalgimonas zhirmunskyi]